MIVDAAERMDLAPGPLVGKATAHLISPGTTSIAPSSDTAMQWR